VELIVLILFFVFFFFIQLRFPGLDPMLLLLLYFVSCSFATAIPTFVFCQKGVNVSEAYAKPGDKLQIYYMQAPAFEGFFGNLFKYLGIFHCAFGVVNLSSGQNFTIEYDAVNEVLNATLPVITENADGSTNLTWYDKGGVCVSKVLNETYYNAGFQFVTQVNGSVFNAFLDWSARDNQTFKEYQLITTLSSWPESWNPRANFSASINSSTCYDFNWRGMDFLLQSGAKLDYSEPMKHDFIATISAPPREVDYNDAFWRPQIDKFYKALRHSLHVSVEEWLLLLEDLVLGSKFVHANQKYYVIDPVYSPYFVRKYLPFNLPGQP
jgi:hypothetical protein